MDELNALPLEDLYRDFSRTGLITRLLELARDEDLGPEWERTGGDVTSAAYVPGYVRGKAGIVARGAGVAAGLACLPELMHLFKADCDLSTAHRDGEPFTPGQTIATLDGSMRSILAIERTMLNLLSRLSGIATRTRAFVDRVQGTGAKIYDTRKTTPGLRLLEKYAVRCGGGSSHRLGLYDAVLFKDNHLASTAKLNSAPGQAVSSLVNELTRAVRMAKQEAPAGGLRFIELEVDTLDQLREVLSAGGAGVQVVLLDNMSIEHLAQGVAMRNELAPRVQLEASGGVTLETVGAIAATGVDRISVGSLTHGATSVDLGLDVR
jgi:nicotinate-nucleotide pyrophosphorylase (carboxylating)